MKRITVFFLLLSSLAFAQDEKKEQNLIVLRCSDMHNALTPRELDRLTEKIHEKATETLRGSISVVESGLAATMIAEALESENACGTEGCARIVVENNNLDYGTQCDVFKDGKNLEIRFQLYSQKEKKSLAPFTERGLKNSDEALELLSKRLPDEFKKILPGKAPSAPLDFAATPGNGHVVLAWKAPQSDGNRQIAGYEVSVNGSPKAVSSATYTYTFSDLENGKRYDFKVRAVNAVGKGEAAEASTTPKTTPSAPQNFSAVPSDGRIVISWGAPLSNGGSEITGYEVSVDDGTWMPASSSTGHTFAGLSNGKSYTFKFRAVNANGKGTEASITETPNKSASATPTTAPAATATIPATGYTAQIVTEPAGAALRLNGQSIQSCPKTPCQIQLYNNRAQLYASLGEYEADTSVAISMPNQLINIKMRQKTYTLSVVAPAGSYGKWNLRVDGDLLSSNAAWVKAGNYNVSASNSCYEDIDLGSVSVKNDEEIYISYTRLKPKNGNFILRPKFANRSLKEPVFVDGKKVGETPYQGSAPICSQVKIGEGSGAIDVKLESGKTIEYAVDKSSFFGLKIALSPPFLNEGLDDIEAFPFGSIKIGIFTNVHFVEIFSFSPEINLAVKDLRFNEKQLLKAYDGDKEVKGAGNVDGSYGENEVHKTILGLNIPLLFRIYPMSAVYLAAGPSLDIDFGIGRDVRVYYSYNGYSSYYGNTTLYEQKEYQKNTIDFGLVFGGGIYFGNHFSIDYKYNMGLTDVVEGLGTLSYWEIGLGWLF